MFRIIYPWLCVYITISYSLPSPAKANPVFGKIFTTDQPDGSTIKVKIWGDEFYKVVESLDGYTLIRDPITKFICYASMSDDGNDLISTGISVGQSIDHLNLRPHTKINPNSAQLKVQKARARFRPHAEKMISMKSRKITAPTSNIIGICLLVDFLDDPGTIDPVEVNNFLNQVGYNGFDNNGSIRDYFYDTSDGHLLYTNYATDFYYRALHDKDYYADPDAGSARASELVLEALNNLENLGFDYSQYDGDGDGYIDAINIFYAGNAESLWGSGLWAHAGSLYSFQADGVSSGRYQMSPMTTQGLKLGTFCHENGHLLLGWPDLYDFDFDSAGIGVFCLMSHGSFFGRNPIEPCAYLKHLAGWTTTIILSNSQSGLQVPSDANVLYKYSRVYDYEYYLIENRQRTGRDSYLRDEGLAIWHIDIYGDNSDQDMTPDSHYEVTLVQADGNWDLENDINNGDNTDLWAAPNYKECNAYSNPNTNWWWPPDTPSSLWITDISDSSPNMTFTFILDCDANNDCDDGYFCNGAETCLDGMCFTGINPCPDLLCDEDQDNCVDCFSDDDCDDGDYCNGQEYCYTGLCEIGGYPCPGQLCDEANETCVDCLIDGDCDDGYFCNGAETCLEGMCVTGINPCPGQLCVEDDETCVDCLIDGDCDDGYFCNGAETCFDGMCFNGINPCPGQLCDEDQDNCVDCFSDDDCDDGAYCNGQEVCISNVCIVESDPCPGQFCDEVSSRCVDCFVAEDCDDEFFCNGLETCWGGQCVAGSPPCIDLDCDELNDVCAAYSNAENGDDEENSADSNSFSGDDNNATSDDEEILPPTQGAPEDQVSDTGICGNGINFMAALMLLGIGFMRSRLRLQRW